MGRIVHYCPWLSHIVWKTKSHVPNHQPVNRLTLTNMISSGSLAPPQIVRCRDSGRDFEASSSGWNAWNVVKPRHKPLGMGFSDKHGDDLGMVPLALCHRNHTGLKKCKHIYIMFLDYEKIFAESTQSPPEVSMTEVQMHSAQLNNPIHLWGSCW